MSEVALRAAYGAYKQYRSSNQMSDLYDSVVKGQAEAGHRITHIYSFIDVLNDVQLYYCEDGNRDDLLASPHVKKLALLWEDGAVYRAPKYLKRAYAEILRAKGVAESAITALGLPSESGPWWKFW